MTPIRDDFDRWLEQEAPSLRQHWDSPELWPRIAGSLEAERRPVVAARTRLPWALAAAACCLFLLPITWWFWKSQSQPPALLTDQTLTEVKNAERAYAQSIDKLSRLASPRVQNPSSPLIASYREKLILIDDAIAGLKVEAERNPYNNHIQNELLACYREKQKTLEGILSETPSPVTAP